MHFLIPSSPFPRKIAGGMSESKGFTTKVVSNYLLRPTVKKNLAAIACSVCDQWLGLQLLSFQQVISGFNQWTKVTSLMKAMMVKRLVHWTPD